MEPLTEANADSLTLIVRNVANPKVERGEAYIGMNALRLELKAPPAGPATITGLQIEFKRFGAPQPTLHLSCAGWTATAIRDGIWKLTPGAPRPAETLTIDATNVNVAGEPGGLAHIVAAYALAGGEGDRVGADVMIQRAPSPDPTRTERPFSDFSWIASQTGAGVVRVTPAGFDPVQNELIFELGNPAPPLTAAATAGPEFYLSLIFVGDEDPKVDTTRALTTLKYASGALGGGPPMELTADRRDWGPAVSPDFRDDSARHVWIIRPSRLLDRNESVRFTLSNICLPFRLPGQPSFEPGRSTYLFLQYANVPGYPDGFYYLRIQKEIPKVRVVEFEQAETKKLEPGESPHLLWRTSAASRVVLTFEIGGVRYVRSSDSVDPADRIPLQTRDYQPRPAPAEANTGYLLEAFDALGHTDRDTLSIHMWRPRIVEKSFVATPTGGLPATNVSLAWRTEEATSCSLSDSVGALRNVGVPLLSQGYPVLAAAANMTYTLAATRGTAAVSAQVHVNPHRFPAGVPLPPFPVDDAFALVQPATAAEWAAAVLFPGASLRKGRYNPAGAFVESEFDVFQSVIVEGSVRPASAVSYLAVHGVLAGLVDIGTYPFAGEQNYRGWRATQGWAAGPPVAFGGFFWFRRELKWPVPSREPTSTIYAKTDRLQRPSRYDPSFKLWAFTWNR